MSQAGLSFGFCFYIIFLWSSIIVGCAYVPGTAAVRWEFFQHLTLTWNEASHFCHTQDGHMVTPNTRLAMRALGKASVTWFGNYTMKPLIFPGFQYFWMGLFSAEPNAIPNIWERDCSLREDTFQMWAIGEPNFFRTDFCVSLAEGYRSGDLLWRTDDCDEEYFVICEYDQGNCTHDDYFNKTMTTQPDSWANDVSDVNQCWDLCLDTRVLGTECVATVYSQERGTCNLYLGMELLSMSKMPTIDEAGSILMIRECFEILIDSTTTTYNIVNKDPDPLPTGKSCSRHYEQANYQNFVPANLKFRWNSNATLENTSLSTSSAVELKEGETTRSLLDDSSTTIQTRNTSLTEALTSPPQSSVNISFGDTATLDLRLEATDTIEPQLETTISLSQKTAASKEQVTSSEETGRHLATTSHEERMLLDETGSVTEPAATTTEMKTARMTVTSFRETALPDGRRITSSITSPKLLYSQFTDFSASSSDDAGGSNRLPLFETPAWDSATSSQLKPKSPGKSTSRTTTYLRCPCACRYNRSLPLFSEAYKNGSKVSSTKTSKYRRSKTSAYMNRSLNTSLGVAFVAGSFSLILAFLLCDFSRVPVGSCPKSNRLLKSVPPLERHIQISGPGNEFSNC